VTTTPQEVAERALEATSGADGCVAIVDESDSVHLRWASNSPIGNGAERSRRLTVVALAGGAVGVASHVGPLLDGDAVRDVATAAERSARAAVADGSQPLVEADATVEWADPPCDVEVGVLGRVTSALHTAAARTRRRRLLLHAYAEQRARTTYLASSSGLRLRHVQPTGVVDLVVAAPDRSAWRGVTARRISEVDIGALAEKLERQVAAPARRVEVEPGRYEVLLAPSCVADLMVRLYRAAGAREALSGQSPFSRASGETRIGERITREPLTLRSDPGAPGLECAPFVVARASNGRVSALDNGLPLAPTEWIADGVLNALVQTRETATTTKQPCTAEIDNLVLEGGPDTRSLDEMIRTTDRALLVTSLWYVRDVDPRRLLVTGLTRDGVHLVEHGEVTAAAADVRFNESPLELLDRVTEVGRTEPALPREWGDYFTRVAMPPLRLDGFGVAPASV